MDKFAALDLGTNTFHLLIASFTEEGNLIEHYRKREYIHLAADGIRTIGDEPFDRALRCIKNFSEVLNQHVIREISCSGTAAMRTASNGPDLVKAIFDISGIRVNVIDGITEARYIYEGISLAIPETKYGNHLLMDIGGGSVEFIVIKDGHYLWSDSYPIGIAVLKREFHKSEPISSDEIRLINQFIRDKIGKLLYTCRRIKFKSLVGASGSFEVLADLASAPPDALSVDVSLDLFLATYESLISQTLEERLSRPDIPNDRATLIVVAFQLMEYVLSQVKCEKIQVSKYAMKEGMLASLRRKYLPGK
jgi:exopolyphosphatase/guanosine-5'-triphosphate,3'-diphosphate pyrophosphatase